MTRATVIIRNDADRAKIARWAAGVPEGTRVDFKEQKRSTDQNAKLWACLTDVSQQVAWHDLKLTPNDWKLLFMDALNREARMVPNLDGNGFVNLGRSSSDLCKGEMADLITLIHMFADKHGAKLNEETIKP